QFFSSLSIALAVAVLLSLPVALAVLPSLAARFLKPVRRASVGQKAAERYAGVLDRALGRSGAVVAVAIGLVALGLFLGSRAAAAPGLRIEFVQVLADMLGDLQGSPEPVEVKISGPDAATLRTLAAQAAGKLRDTPGLVDFFDGDEGCAPEIDLRVRASEAGRQ